mmetsp:Transcript_4250/g.7109  ORF Transcript_4250/g.7109 Transcript_4250/m.7109 type:complete len:228 (+) Transcript_4250:202-885(+)
MKRLIRCLPTVAHQTRVVQARKQAPSVLVLNLLVRQSQSALQSQILKWGRVFTGSLALAHSAALSFKMQPICDQCREIGAMQKLPLSLCKASPLGTGWLSWARSSRALESWCTQQQVELAVRQWKYARRWAPGPRELWDVQAKRRGYNTAFQVRRFWFVEVKQNMPRSSRRYQMAVDLTVCLIASEGSTSQLGWRVWTRWEESYTSAQRTHMAAPREGFLGCVSGSH